MIFAIELPGIHRIMPNAVKSSGNRCNRCKECICEPNGKDSIFLSQRLSAGNRIAVATTDVATKGKLHNATNERHQGYPHLHEYREVAVNN